MLKKIINILNRPFPILESNREKILTPFFFGSFVSLFLLVFEPFGLDRIQGNKILYLLGYGLITTFVILFHHFVTMNIFKQFFLPDKWTIWKSFIHNVIIIFPIAILNWIYFENVNKPFDISHSLLSFIFITFVVGILPSPFFIIYFERRLNSKNLSLSKRVNNKLNNKEALKNQNNYDLEIDFASAKLKINVNDFLCVKSMGNYVTFYYLQNNSMKKEIIRGTMKKFDELFSENKEIIRCHKSHFVNLNKVKTTSGNARALYLHLDELDFPIPVSRNFSKEIILGTI